MQCIMFKIPLIHNQHLHHTKMQQYREMQQLKMQNNYVKPNNKCYYATLIAQQRVKATASATSLSNNTNFNIASSRSALSHRQLPIGSPKMADKKKKRKHRANIRKQNEFEIDILETVGVLERCEAVDDECPRKDGSCKKYHGDAFIKHYWCQRCDR